MTTKTREEIRRIKARVEGDLLKLPGVAGVDIGYKHVRGKPTDELAIRVLVRTKKPAEAVPPSELIPPTIDGVPTDVIERDFQLKSSSPVY
jgi:hypothetical protein